MIKRFKTLALAVVLCLAGCMSSPDSYDPDYVISFKPAVSTISGDQPSASVFYPTSSTFGVWAYMLPSGKKWSDNSSQASTWLENAKVSCSGDAWKTTDTKHWGATGEQLTFFAYSPSDAGASFDKTSGISITGYNTLTESMDFLYTDAQADIEKNAVTGVVAIPFKHAIGKVELRAMSSQSDVSIVIKSVKICDVHYKGDFHSLPTAGWDLTSDKTDLEFCTEETRLTTKEVSLAEFNVLAQNEARPVKILFDIYVGDTRTDADVQATAKPITGTWILGCKHVYTLDIMSNSVTYKTDPLDK